MKRIQKLTQQRRRQLHIHIPPSGIMEVPYGDVSARARPEAPRQGVQAR